MPRTRVGARPTPRAHPVEHLPIGAHVAVARRGYSHHGIHVGGGRIVHYTGLCRFLRRGAVEETSLERFANGGDVDVRNDLAARFPAEVVVARARSRLGENRYRIATNNCEHFCAWCLCGEIRSNQIDRLLAAPRAAMRVACRLIALFSFA